MSPEGTNLVLTSDIPDGELNVLVLDSLNVETYMRQSEVRIHGRREAALGLRRWWAVVHTNGGDGGDNLTKLQLVENSGFTGGIESDHQNTHLLLPPQLIKQLGKGETHDCDFGGEAWSETDEAGFWERLSREIRGRQSNILRW